MVTPYLGEVRMFGGNFAPAGWALCNGQILAIASNAPLFSLLGTTYGGNGQTNFGLPDLRGRLPMHQGTGQGLTPRVIGELGGVENVTLTADELPSHSHALNATSADGGLPSPANGLPATPKNGATPYLYLVPGTSQVNPVAMGASITPNVGGQPHDNLMPSLCVSFIIATAGVFPSRN